MKKYFIYTILLSFLILFSFTKSFAIKIDLGEKKFTDKCYDQNFYKTNICPFPESLKDLCGDCTYEGEGKDLKNGDTIPNGMGSWTNIDIENSIPINPNSYSDEEYENSIFTISNSCDSDDCERISSPKIPNSDGKTEEDILSNELFQQWQALLESTSKAINAEQSTTSNPLQEFLGRSIDEQITLFEENKDVIKTIIDRYPHHSRLYDAVKNRTTTSYSFDKTDKVEVNSSNKKAISIYTDNNNDFTKTDLKLGKIKPKGVTKFIDDGNKKGFLHEEYEVKSAKFEISVAFDDGVVKTNSVNLKDLSQLLSADTNKIKSITILDAKIEYSTEPTNSTFKDIDTTKYSKLSIYSNQNLSNEKVEELFLIANGVPPKKISDFTIDKKLQMNARIISDAKILNYKGPFKNGVPHGKNGLITIVNPNTSLKHGLYGNYKLVINGTFKNGKLAKIFAISFPNSGDTFIFKKGINPYRSIYTQGILHNPCLGECETVRYSLDNINLSSKGRFKNTPALTEKLIAETNIFPNYTPGVLAAGFATTEYKRKGGNWLPIEGKDNLDYGIRTSVFSLSGYNKFNKKDEKNINNKKDIKEKKDVINKFRLGIYYSLIDQIHKNNQKDLKKINNEINKEAKKLKVSQLVIAQKELIESAKTNKSENIIYNTANDIPETGFNYGIPGKNLALTNFSMSINREGEQKTNQVNFCNIYNGKIDFNFSIVEGINFHSYTSTNNNIQTLHTNNTLIGNTFDIQPYGNMPINIGNVVTQNNVMNKLNQLSRNYNLLRSAPSPNNSTKCNFKKSLIAIGNHNLITGLPDFVSELENIGIIKSEDLNPKILTTKKHHHNICYPIREACEGQNCNLINNPIFEYGIGSINTSDAESMLSKNDNDNKGSEGSPEGGHGGW